MHGTNMKIIVKKCYGDINQNTVRQILRTNTMLSFCSSLPAHMDFIFFTHHFFYIYTLNLATNLTTDTFISMTKNLQ